MQYCSTRGPPPGAGQKLVGAGADTGDALHSAVHDGHTEIVNTLLENGVPVNSRDWRGLAPLHVAARVGDAEMIQSLLLEGVDKDTLDDRGFTALYWAAHWGHPAATEPKCLLAAGADAGLRCGEEEELALHTVARNGYDVDVVVMRALIEHAGDVDARGIGGATAALPHLHVGWDDRDDPRARLSWGRRRSTRSERQNAASWCCRTVQPGSRARAGEAWSDSQRQDSRSTYVHLT